MTKNPVLRIKEKNTQNLVAGDLLREIDDNKLQTISGGTNDWISKQAANTMGLGDNYGRVCTVSAECAFTVTCGGTK